MQGRPRSFLRLQHRRADVLALCIPAVVLATTDAAAQSTQELASACEAVASSRVIDGKVEVVQDFDTGRCWGAFSVVQWAVVLVDDVGTRRFGVCAPPESTRTQLVAVFVEYARRNPARLHERFTAVVFDALRDSFPCDGGLGDPPGRIRR